MLEQKNNGWFVKGHLPWNKGVPATPEMATHLRKIARHKQPNTPEFKAACSSFGTKNSEWKGDHVGYTALHEWVKRHKPKQDFCTDCKQVKKRLDLANISQQYKRDINDYEWLCVSCHMHKDGRLDKLHAITRGKRWKKKPKIVDIAMV